MNPSWTLSDEKKPKGNGRLDDCFVGALQYLDELEIYAHAIQGVEHSHNWTLDDLTRLRRVVSNLDQVGARVERRLDKGPRPTGIGVSGA